jgi:TRAP-type C4-dicarboxylate transport system permease small subunit
MTDWLTRLESRGTRVARFAALVGIIGLVVFAIMVILDVFMRWMFNDPIDGVADVAPLVVAIVVASTFPLAVAERHNVTINFLGNWLGPRGRAWLEVLAGLVTTVFFILLAWQFVFYAIKLDARGQTTWVLRLPVAPWWSVVAFFIVVCAAIRIIVFMVQFRHATDVDKGARDQPPRDETPFDGGL